MRKVMGCEGAEKSYLQDKKIKKTMCQAKSPKKYLCKGEKKSSTTWNLPWTEKQLMQDTNLTYPHHFCYS